jgi:ApbE superfamily uncharacterized protein (UPF0280 family)
MRAMVSGCVPHRQRWAILLSTGTADAVCVVARSCALADAAATAIGNRIRSSREIKTAIAFGKRITGVLGIVVVAGRKWAHGVKLNWSPRKEKKVEFWGGKG